MKELGYKPSAFFSALQVQIQAITVHKENTNECAMLKKESKRSNRLPGTRQHRLEIGDLEK